VIISMRKITLIGAQEKKEEVLQALQKAALLHLIANKKQKEKDKAAQEKKKLEKEEKKKEIEKSTEEIVEIEKEEPLKEDLQNIERVKKLLIQLGRTLKGSAKSKKEVKVTDWHHICQRVDEILQKRESLKQKMISVQKKRAKLVPWGDFSFQDIEKLEERGIFLQFFIASGKFFDKLDLSGVYHFVVSREGGRIHFITISLDKKYEGLSEASLPLKSISEFDEELAHLESEAEQVADEIIALSHKVTILEKAEIEIQNRIKFTEAKNNMIAEGPIFILQGWIPQHWVSKLKKKLQKFDLAFLEEPARKDEEVPVILRNKPAISPFELLTDLYSRPQYQELDTTPIVAPFFAIFFAMCLTDAGYGVIMFLLSTFALKYFKLGPGLRKGLKLVQILTLFIIGFGLMTGNIFGIQFSEGSLVRKLALIDASDQMRLFTLAIFFGIFQLSSGIILKAFNEYKQGEPVKAVGSFGIAVLFWGAVITYMGHRNPGIAFMIAGAALMILFSAPVKNPFKRIGLGIWAIYGTSGLLGDLLSYARLFALALATGIIAQVVNTIALQIKGVPIIGWPVMIVILVLGHGGNIALGTLSGFVHTIRLQFVEFYKQFYIGMGTPFEAFQEQKIK
jgi:V/A-type H+-transporting ATPase subunit I